VALARLGQIDLAKVVSYPETMKPVNVHEAKTRLSELLKKVEAGEEVIIARAGKPVARLVRAGTAGTRVFGSARGLFTVSDDFDDPLPTRMLREFYK
jgi:prevent-host-death family protein